MNGSFKSLGDKPSLCRRKCTAGHSFYVIDVNGLVSRCWFHKNECCGTVAGRQFWNWDGMKCTNRKCAPSCEPCYNTIWEDGVTPKRGLYVLNDDDINNPQHDHVFFQAIMCNACNFACPYCVSGSNRVAIAEDKKQWLTTKQWVDWWRFIKGRHKTVSVTIVGGEPTIFPGFGEIATEISQIKPTGTHRLFTNCSLAKPLEPFTSGQIKNFEVFAALHPTNPAFNLTRFTDLFMSIRENMTTVLLMVDTLENLPYKAAMVQHFRALGVTLYLSADEVKTKIENRKDVSCK